MLHSESLFYEMMQLKRVYSSLSTAQTTWKLESHDTYIRLAADLEQKRRYLRENTTVHLLWKNRENKGR